MGRPDNTDYSVSVVIPAYNAEKYIGRALDSALAQTRRPDEIIVVDDGSTDNTADVIKSYAPKVHYIRQENGGASVARNTGIEAAAGQWIAFLDADDEWLPEKLQLQIEHLKRNSNLVWSYSNYIICPSDGEHQRDAFQAAQSAPLMKGREYYEDYLAAYAGVGHLLTSSTIIKRNVLAEAGYFRVGQWWAQDTDMFLRVAYRWPRIGYIPQPLAIYHAGLPGSITEKNRGLVTQRCDLVERHLKLAASYARGDAFRPCALEMLRHCMRTTLAGNPYADVSEVLERFDSLLPTPLKREMRLRMKWPRVGRFCLFVYFRIKNALRVSKPIPQGTMKIAIMTNKFPSLSETFILDQITGLLDMGQEVVILAFNKSNELKVHADVKEYRLLDRAYYVPNVPDTKILCLFKALILVIINLPKYPGPMTRFLCMFLAREKKLSLKVLYLLLELGRRKVDLLQCHYGPNGDLGTLLKRAIPKMKLVTMFHGYDIRLGLKEGGGIYRRLFKYGDMFLANSQYTCDRLMEFGADPDKTVVHPVGTDLSKFTSLDNSAGPGQRQKTTVVTVARLVEEKAIQYAIEAFNKLVESNPGRDLTYKIVGAGPCETKLRELVQRLVLEKKVTFVGSADQQEVIDVLRQAHIFLHSSIAETLGAVLIEAQALQVPVVATDVGGVPQAVDKGKSAFLVPPRDANALAERLQFLIDNPDICGQMGRWGRQYVEKNYNIELLNQRLLEIFERLLGGS